MTNETNRERFSYGTRVRIAGKDATVIEDYGLEDISVRFDEAVRGCRPLVCVNVALVVAL